MQNTSQLLMIKPVNFGYNAETAVNNAFQVKGDNTAAQQKALKEFNDFVLLLSKNNIAVTVIEDTPEPFTPDSIFPNNWISFHENGSIFLFPMFADNRRKERKQHVLEIIKTKFHVAEIIDLSGHENENLFLEGTGSMVLDRDNKIAYACLSPRTDKKVLNEFCSIINYIPVSFASVDPSGVAVYHTNVMMCVADKYVVICIDSIIDETQRKKVIDTIESTNKEIIPISTTQMNSFAGNMLQVKNTSGEKLLIMSSQAYRSLHNHQVNALNKYNRILHSSLTTIETAGGGSARCMLAEIFLPLKK